MDILVDKYKKSFSLLEVLFAMALVALMLPTIGVQSYRYIETLKLNNDVENLKTQLQIANDIVLHCNTPYRAIFKQTSKGLACKLEFENASIEKEIPSFTLYKHIHNFYITTNNREQKRSLYRLFCSSSGGLKEPIYFTVKNLKGKKQSILIRGYPHVLEIEKAF